MKGCDGVKINKKNYEKAIQAAEDAFWEEFGKHYQCASGDLPPDACCRFTNAIEEVTEEWVSWNVNKDTIQKPL